MQSRINLKYVFIELTRECNFSCVFCPIDKIKRPKGIMPFDKAMSLLHELANERVYFKDITFSLQNEPLMYYRIFDVLSKAKEYNMVVNFPTNASLLNKKSFEKLLNLKIDRIVLSLHSPDRGTFLLRRAKNIDYDTYMDRIYSLISVYIERLLRSKNDASLIEIHYLNTSRFRPNCKMVESKNDIPKIIVFWRDILKEQFLRLGQHYDDFRPHTDIPSTHKSNFQNDENEIGVALLPNLYLQFKNAHTWANTIGASYGNKSKFHCRIGLSQLCIAWNGDCTTCCLDYNFRNLIGNIWESGSLEQVWFGKKAVEFRNKLKKNYPPSDFCRNCMGQSKYEEKI